MTRQDVKEIILENKDKFTNLSKLDNFMCERFNCESAYEGFFEAAINNSSYAYKIEVEDEGSTEYIEVDMQYELLDKTDDSFENYYIKFTGCQFL